MAKPEELSFNPADLSESEQQPQLPLREQLLRAIDEKIFEHPFYTGDNSKIWGLSTPIRRNREEMVDAPGLTPEDFYSEPQEAELPATPEDVYKETENEMQSQSEVSEMGAEEMFEGTGLVLPSVLRVAYRKNGRRINWMLKASQWGRNIEAVGHYLGSGLTFEQIAEKYGFGTRQGFEQELKRFRREEMGIADSDRNSNDRKPRSLWDLRAELGDSQSALYQLVQDLESGKGRKDLVLKYGHDMVNRYRQMSDQFGLSIEIPTPSEELDKIFEELENPELPLERKKEIMGLVGNSGTGFDRYHMRSLLNLATNSGLFLRRSDLERLRGSLEINGIPVHLAPVKSKEKVVAYNNLYANGDEEKIREIFQNATELADLRIPTVVNYGKKSETKVNTAVVKKSGVGVSRKIKRAIGDSGQESVEEFLKDCPVGVFLMRDGSLYVLSNEKEAFDQYIEKKSS